MRTEQRKSGGLSDPPILQGIWQVLVETGKTVMISDTYGKADRVPGLIRTFLQHRDEGLL